MALLFLSPMWIHTFSTETVVKWPDLQISLSISLSSLSSGPTLTALLNSTLYPPFIEMFSSLLLTELLQSAGNVVTKHKVKRHETSPMNGSLKFTYKPNTRENIHTRKYTWQEHYYIYHLKLPQREKTWARDLTYIQVFKTDVLQDRCSNCLPIFFLIIIFSLLLASTFIVIGASHNTDIKVVENNWKHESCVFLRILLMWERGRVEIGAAGKERNLKQALCPV